MPQSSKTYVPAVPLSLSDPRQGDKGTEGTAPSKETAMARQFCAGDGGAMTNDPPLFELTLAEPPPSVNGLFVNVPGKGRVKASGYARWRKAAAWAARAARQGPRPLAGDLVAEIEIGLTVRRRFDLDNRMKALFDALTAGGVIEDDSQIAAIHARKADRPGARVRLYQAALSVKSTRTGGACVPPRGRNNAT